MEAIEGPIKSKAEETPVGLEQHVPTIEHVVRIVNKWVRSKLYRWFYTPPSYFLKPIL